MYLAPKEIVDASVYIATSLDGFIARENGELDWLPLAGGSAGEDYGYETFIKTVDAVVMGRRTYEKVLTFGHWPFGQRSVVVLSSSPIEFPASVPSTVESMSGKPSDILARLEARGHRHVYVDGGATIQRFLEAGAIQRLIITRVPVLIGSGLPLFGRLPHDVRLKHVRTRDWPSGMVQSEYTVVS